MSSKMYDAQMRFLKAKDRMWQAYEAKKSANSALVPKNKPVPVPTDDPRPRTRYLYEKESEFFKFGDILEGLRGLPVGGATA